MTNKTDIIRVTNKTDIMHVTNKTDNDMLSHNVWRTVLINNMVDLGLELEHTYR